MCIQGGGEGVQGQNPSGSGHSAKRKAPTKETRRPPTEPKYPSPPPRYPGSLSRKHRGPHRNSDIQDRPPNDHQKPIIPQPPSQNHQIRTKNAKKMIFTTTRKQTPIPRSTELFWTNPTKFCQIKQNSPIKTRKTKKSKVHPLEDARNHFPHTQVKFGDPSSKTAEDRSPATPQKSVPNATSPIETPDSPRTRFQVPRQRRKTPKPRRKPQTLSH